MLRNLLCLMVLLFRICDPDSSSFYSLKNVNVERILILLVLSFSCYVVKAQATAESLLNELPPIPENLCIASTDAMDNFEKGIRAVEVKIENIQLQEKSKREKAEEEIGFNQSIFQNPAAEARLTAIGADIEKCRIKLNDAYGKYIEEKIAVQEKIGLGFHQRSYDLSQEYWEAKQNGGNTQHIQDKIIAFVQFRCDTLSQIQRRNIETAHDLLLNQWEIYEKMNAMQDESSRIMFTGYPHSTQNGGFLLDGIKLYIEELRKAFEWNPANVVMDELGVGSQ
ncbi:MAG: hypothetical protein K9G58_07480 [Bacteroidales bacterium]|nr:hypothetical protein [Bacteroidales bacterium]